MPEIRRLSDGNDCFELGFVEREATPNWAMKLGIRLHLAGLSLSNIISEDKTTNKPVRKSLPSRRTSDRRNMAGCQCFLPKELI
jgi:hypothetical protein